MTFRAAVCCAAALLLQSCASFSQAAAANKRNPGALEAGNFKPALPPAENYGPDPKLTCPPLGVNGAVQDQLNERFKGKETPRPDGRLCAIADTLLGWQGEKDDLPPESVRTFLAQYFGLPVTFRELIITTVDSEDVRQLADALTEPIASFASTAQAPRYGLMTQRLKKGQTKAVLVMFDESLELSPVPRRLPAGGSAQLEGKVVGKIEKPKVEVVDAVGKLQTVTPEGKSFKVPLSCGDKPGSIYVQITGQREGIELLLASFPIACGGELPPAVKLPAKAAPVAPAEAERKLFERINADRAAVGLKPLENNAALAGVARQIALDRAKGKGTTPTELLRALKEADVASPQVLVTMAQALDDEDAYRRLATSPADRANMLNGEVNQLGIGVAPGPEVNKVPTVIVAALFTKQLPPPDPAAIKAKLYEAIARKRADARTTPLQKDQLLEEVAQKHATAAAAAGGALSKEKDREIFAPLYQASMTVNVIGGWTRDEQHALEVAEQPGIVQDAKLVGVGTAVGNSPQFGKHSVWVEVLLATRHPAAKAKPPAAKKKK
jgi:uncharacterized protein YkwD